MPNVSSDSVGLAFVLAVVAAGLGLLLSSKLSRTLRIVLAIGLALRVIGSFARYGVLMHIYEGNGDSIRYHRVGLEYAERFSVLDFSPLWNTAMWESHSWWGTQFMFFPSGLVLTVIGPTLLGEFVVFSLFAYVGLALLVLAFHRTVRSSETHRYAAWIFLFPSLWFWPSSVGKEAIVLLGIGLATFGFVGKYGRISVLPLLSGVALLFSIRPQIAAVFIVCALLSQTISRRSQWTLGSWLQAGIVAVVGLTTIWYAGRELGIGTLDAEGFQDYVEGDAARRVGGGSSIDAVPTDWDGIPIALLNVLTRPFPWETRNFMMLISATEIWGLWFLVAWRRRNVLSALRNWRTNRLVTFSFAFIVIYSIGLGMMMSNLAIIARQRIFLLPFLFVLLEGVPDARRARQVFANRSKDSARRIAAHLRTNSLVQ